MCTHFTSVVSADAAHTELARTLTTAPPAKRQPASSTGNRFKIMSLLHCITHQWQLILSFKQPQIVSWTTACLYFVALKMFNFHFFLSFSQFYYLFIFLTMFFFVSFFISYSSCYSAVLPFSPTLKILLHTFPLLQNKQDCKWSLHQHWNEYMYSRDKQRMLSPGKIYTCVLCKQAN